MTGEHIDNLERDHRAVAWDIFRYFTPDEDEARFTAMYVGHFDSRAAFGEALLRETYDADERLKTLPRWLQGYVRLDGNAVASDFERAGHYHLIAGPDASIYVFDGQAFGVREQAKT
jgi:hypothetical protein